MPSALKFIGGGLLTGIGKGLVEQAKETGKAKRERALADLEQENRLKRDEKQLEGKAKFERLLTEFEQENRLELEGVKQGNRQGLLGERLELDRDLTALREKGAGERRTEASRSAENVAKITAGSRKAVAEIAAGKATDTSAAEKRFWDIAVKTATTPEMDKGGIPTGRDTTDWNAVALDMDARSLPKLAATARRRALNDQTREDRKVALPLAEERVEAMDDSFFGKSDTEVYKQYGGSRTKALDAILRKEMKKLADARSGKGVSVTRPAAAGGEFYTGETPPPGFPNARRSSKDGFWYFPDPKRQGKFRRVLN